jgi:serine/threonine-protein kinase
VDDSTQGEKRAPFDTVWDALPRRAQVESVSTLDTVAYESEPAPQVEEGLPGVGHLASLGDELGRGGSGEVFSAEQVGLHRRIAVKRPLGGDLEEELTSALLREARVIGYLEHPNIPPVHYVGTGDERSLLVGLKQIEGEDLATRLQDESALKNLEEHLDILIQISNAVGFAHNRGILHLDLKPANVMTGRHGEIYVLDWGLAVAVREDVPAHLPRPILDGQVYGTPAFVAPETVTGDESTTATDVYQLGGILHCMLTGNPPNGGTTTFEVLQSAYEPEPRSFPREVPPPLAAICKMALALEPEDRYADANAFREALVAYRRDRHELEAIATAQEQVDALRAVLEENDDEPSAVYQSYGRARQAIDEAASLHGDDEVTRVLLQNVLEAVIEWELERENAGSAAFLLSELPESNTRLQAAVVQEQERQDKQKAELRALRDEIDPEIGSTVKLVMLATLGFAIALAELVPYLLSIETTPRRVLIGNLVYFCFLVSTTYMFRWQLAATRVNRGLALLVWLLSLNGLFLRIGAVQGLLELHAMVRFDLALVTIVSIFGALELDRRLAYAVPFYALGTLAAVLWPSMAMPIYGLTHFLGLSTVGLAIKFARVANKSED